MYRRKFVSIEANLIALKERIIVPILHVLLLIEDLYLIQSAVVRPPPLHVSHSYSICCTTINPFFVAHITNQLAGTNSKCKEALFFIPVHLIGFIVSITFASSEGWWLFEFGLPRRRASERASERKRTNDPARNFAADLQTPGPT